MLPVLSVEMIGPVKSIILLFSIMMDRDISSLKSLDITWMRMRSKKMTRFQAIIILTLIFCLVCVGLGTIFNNQHYNKNKDAWVQCGSGFFYDTTTSTMETVYELEALASQCPSKKLSSRGSHEVELDSEVLITPAGTSITHTDDFMIDNLLVINWEVSKENHLAIAEMYLE
jgi:hypothetical protein